MKVNFRALAGYFGFQPIVGIAEVILNRYISNIEDWDEPSEGPLDPFICLEVAMDDGLIYDDDLWDMMRYYFRPQDADFNKAWELFYDDLLRAIPQAIDVDGDGV